MSMSRREHSWRLIRVLALLMIPLSPSVALGNLDAVFANDPARNRVCLGDGAGGFTCSDVSADTNRSIDVALGDVDGDGNLDPSLRI